MGAWRRLRLASRRRRADLSRPPAEPQLRLHGQLAPSGQLAEPAALELAARRPGVDPGVLVVDEAWAVLARLEVARWLRASWKPMRASAVQISSGPANGARTASPPSGLPSAKPAAKEVATGRMAADGQIAPYDRSTNCAIVSTVSWRIFSVRTRSPSTPSE